MSVLKEIFLSFASIVLWLKKYKQKNDEVKIMKVSIDEVKYIAKLSKLKFSDEEAAKFASEFESILDNFQYLNELDLEIEDDMDKEELKPIIRKDEVKVFECKDLFRNVKDMQDTYIKVPKIIE